MTKFWVANWNLKHNIREWRYIYAFFSSMRHSIGLGVSKRNYDFMARRDNSATFEKTWISIYNNRRWLHGRSTCRCWSTPLNQIYQHNAINLYLEITQTINYINRISKSNIPIKIKNFTHINWVF